VRRRRFLALPLPLLVAWAVAACGAERAALPNPRAEPSKETRRLEFPRAGLSVALSKDVFTARRRSPGVFRASAGAWSVAAFAYRRREQLPRDRQELETARRRLLREARRRDRSYRPIRSRASRVAGAPAIDLVGDQVLSRSRVRIRSVHVFKGRAEYVLELLTPAAEFARANRTLFVRALRSLRVTGELRTGRPKRRRGR
jgi:hypothetical protein